MGEGRLALRLALREMRAGLRGFAIFLACIALGVAAIAAAGSTAQAFRSGLASQAREILGGDVMVRIQDRQFTTAERAAFSRLGQVSYAVAVRAMAEAPGGARRLVELRGVGGAYPLTGKVALVGGISLAQALAPMSEVDGAAVEKPVLDRLGLRLGDRFLVGETPLVARAILVSEPDRLGRGFALGPTVLTRLEGVQTGGFLSAGLPFGETARVALPPGSSLATARRALRSALNHGDKNAFRIRDRDDAAPGLRHLIDQLEYFLGFIGLASLLAGGLGVHGAVGAHLEESKADIAVLKVLGARGSLVRDIHLIRIAVLAVLGVFIGLAIGAAVPPMLGAVVGKDLPVPARFAIYPWPLARAGAFGLLSAAVFALVPLARARATSPAVLLRQERSLAPARGVEIVAAAFAAVGLVALSVATAPTPLAATIMICGVAVSFALLWLLGAAAAWLAGRVRGGAHGPLRIALANLAGPRSAARTASPAIGLGVALVSAVVLVQSSLLAQVEEVAPRTAPAMLFTQIPARRAVAFDAEVAAAFQRRLLPADYLRVPFATGRIVAVRGVRVDRRRIEAGQRWAYDNDISLSAIGPRPANAQITAGHWWRPDYAGPPLAILSTDAAQGAAVKVGDTITVAVLGREIEARVAALRKIEYAGFGANFPLVLDPAAVAGAELSQVAIAKATQAQEARVTRALGRDFAEVNIISVRDELESAGDILRRLSVAVRAVASVAIVAGVLVLAGAIAAGASMRAREAAVLKVLGARSGQILAAHAIEYGAVGAVAGAAGVLFGSAAAYPVVVKVFEATWSIHPGSYLVLIGGSAALACAGGILASIHALAQRPAAVLRAP